MRTPLPCRLAMDVTELDTSALDPAPIAPAWIREGAPAARMRELTRSRDGTAVTALWDCTAGSFDWYYAGDETVHILDGEVVVSDRQGGTRRLRRGDVALFHAGTWVRWHVPRYVRKLAFCRLALPVPVGLGLRLLNRLRGLLRPRQRSSLASLSWSLLSLATF